MRRNTPLITLLSGAALGVILLIASMLATSKAPASGSGGGPGAAGTASADPGGTTAAPAVPGGTTAAPTIPGCIPATASAKSLSHVRRSPVGLGGRPFAVRMTPDRKFSFITLGDSLAVLSNRAGLAPALVHTLQVPGARKGEAITSDGKYLLLAAGGGAKVLSVPDAEQGNVVVLGTLDSPRGRGAVQVTLSPDDQFAFVALQSSGGVAVFNLRQALASGFASSLVGIVPTGKEPVGIAVSADRAHQWLYVTSWGPPGTIGVVSMHLAETHPQKALLTRPPRAAGCQPSRVVTSAHGTVVWVTAQGSNALLAFSAAKLRTDPAHSLIATVHVGQNPIGEQLINGDKRIAVANSDSSPPNLMVIDTKQALCREGKRALVGSIRTGKGPRELELQDGKTLLVTNLGSGRLEAVSINDIPLTSPGTPPPGQCRNN
jgi:DNA-binding beta-propeller fold protein YncE